MKKTLTSLLLLFLSVVTFAQKPFQVILKLDKSIDPKNLNYHYFDGKARQSFTNVDSNKQILVLKGRSDALIPTIDLTYTDNQQGETYFGNYFIDRNDAMISLHHKPNVNLDLQTSKLYHARPVNDTINNKVSRELLALNKKRYIAMWRLQQSIAGYTGDKDSLNRVYLKMVKESDRATIQFLKKYPNDYYSFIKFTRSATEARGYQWFSNDEIREHLAYFKTVFPKKFTESVEGKEFVRTRELMISPLKQGSAAPDFAVKDLDGRLLKLSGMKGKMVLLDFWATWCPPCVAQIPAIKNFRKIYPPEKLAIIGISRDNAIEPLKNMIKQESMDWLHYYDQNTSVCRLYGINYFPTLILLDKQGKVIYMSDLTKDNKEEVAKLLKEHLI